MYYDEDLFCVTDATEEGRWQYVEFSQGTFISDPEGYSTTVESGY